MTDRPQCGTCGAPVDGAVLCTSCTRDLAAALGTIATLADDLEDAVGRHLVRGAGGGANDEHPLLIDPAASAVAGALRTSLHGWVRELMTPTAADALPWPSYTVPGMARWLAARTERIRQHPDAAGMHRDVIAHRRAVVKLVDRRPERVGAGQCEICRGQLWTTDGDRAVCDRCGEAFTGIAQRRLAQAEAADVLGTAAEISGALARIGVRVPRGTITSWASRGRLAARPGKRGGQAVYAMSDVLALASERDRRVKG